MLLFSKNQPIYQQLLLLFLFHYILYPKKHLKNVFGIFGYFFWHITFDKKFDAAFSYFTCINRKNHIYDTIYRILFYCRFRNLNAVLPDICKNTGYIIGFCIFCNYFKVMPHIFYTTPIAKATSLCEAH